MNILITRPLIDAEDIMSKLFSLGHKIIHLPTLKILPKKTDPIDENEYDAFVFTSSNAIRNLNVINQNKTKLCFCVGSITEKLARQKELMAFMHNGFWQCMDTQRDKELLVKLIKNKEAPWLK